MMNFKVDFNRSVGKVKPMHATNNGPVYKFASDQRITNIDAFREAGIPYARNHDAALYSIYGGEHTVDVHNIFPDFDADPYDPASYDFAVTDEYVRVCEFADVRTFYRLGSKIEHGVKKYGTLPPKDFHKWAVICEHIVRHYTEGWADGFRYDMKYWEIWNEPDLDPDDSTHKRCWGGTKLQFFDLFEIAAKHLKGCFPHLKIGGPALAGKMDWAEDFLAEMQKRHVPMDFFSWHRYAGDPAKIARRAEEVRTLLDRYGYEASESILNEWNYVRGWRGDDWYYSLKAEKSLKGSSFIASVMCDSQRGSVDLLMYYDARPTSMNGMFCTDYVCECLKGYYPFKMFQSLYRLGECVESSCDCEEGHICAAKSEDEAAVMLTYFSDDDEKPAEEIAVDLAGFGGENGVEVEIFVLDETRDLEKVTTFVAFGDRVIWKPQIACLTSYLIKLKKQ